MVTRSRRRKARKCRSEGPTRRKLCRKRRSSTRRRRVRSKTRRPRRSYRSRIIAKWSGGAPEPMEIDDEEMEDVASPRPIPDMLTRPILRRAATGAAPTVPPHQALPPPTLAIPTAGTPITEDRTADIARQAAAWQAAYEGRQAQPFTARFQGRQDQTQQGWWEQQERQQARQQQRRDE